MDTFWVAEPGGSGGAGVVGAAAGLVVVHGLPGHYTVIQGIFVIILVPDVELDGALWRKVQSSFMRIVSKQMVGVRRGLQKCMQNLTVSTGSAPWGTLATMERCP
jgi:hypothetical protein